MTKKEVISHLNLRDFQADLGYKKGMEDGIRMGMKIMIEKACEWLSIALDNFHTETQRVDFVDKLKFIDSFKKAMEK